MTLFEILESLDWSTILQAIIIFLSGVITTLVTYWTTNKQTKQTADQTLRDDLMELYREQQDVIEHQRTLLNKFNDDLISLRERNADILLKNADLIGKLAEAQQALIVERGNSARLQTQIDALQEDKVRLANRIIVMEDEIRRLKAVTNTIQVEMKTHE